MLPEVLDYRITSRCNMKCSFCFGTKRDSKIDIKLLQAFLINLKKAGVKKIVLTGGEPTLADEFQKKILMLKDLGFQIVISTNGTFWDNLLLRELVLNNTECVALPLDSISKNQHNQMRGVEFDHYSLVMKILGEIKSFAPKIKIKIGTVLTQENINNVYEILESLPIKPDLWKLYQLSESCTNKEYYQKNHVSNDIFDKVVSDMQNKYQSHRICITSMHEWDRDGQYLFLDPDGDIITIEQNRERILGNYCDDFDILVKKIEKKVNSEKTNRNFNNSFSL